MKSSLSRPFFDFYHFGSSQACPRPGKQAKVSESGPMPEIKRITSVSYAKGRLVISKGVFKRVQVHSPIVSGLVWGASGGL